MEWFAVSSTYYLDPKFDGITSTVERMFLRLMALSRQADLKGILPTNPHVSVGIPSGKRSVSELKSRGILSEMADGKLYFPAWDKWNGIGDELEERRESDRERKRRERAKKAEMSRDNPDMSRGTRQDKTRQDISTYVERSSHVPAAGEETPGPSIPVDGWKLVRDNTPDTLGSTVRSALALEASTMIRGGATERQTADCLRLWMQKPDAGVRLLPHLLANVVKAGMPTAAPGPSTSKAQGWLDVTQDLGSYGQKAITP